MKLDLQKKRALITGSNVEIGKAIAETLAKEGAAVVIHGLEKDRVTSVTKDIEQDGGKAFVFTGDLGTDEGAAYIAKQAQESLGGVDILILTVRLNLKRANKKTSQVGSYTTRK